MADEDQKTMKPARPTVAVKIIKTKDQGPENFGPISEFSGISYCEALSKASQGNELLIRPGSIQVCRWSPPVLGLKEPESDFEKEREPRLQNLTGAILMARIDRWQDEWGEPDVVILRADLPNMEMLVEMAGPDSVFDGSGVDRTMVPELSGRPADPMKARIARASNSVLSALNSVPLWHRFTVWAFKREWTSRMLNWVLDRSMANMSVCRNSTVIPLLTGRLNVSHFCTGGISWGKNPATLMTAGMPYSLYLKIKDRIDY